MDRRRILLVVAVVVALLGTALVYLYVRGSDARANQRFDTVEVLRAVAPIAEGETIDDAAATGKLALEPVPRDYLQPNYQTSIESLSGSVATVAIFPGEQIVSDKFGSESAVDNTPLNIPQGMLAISVNLTDPSRVAGFVNPGSQVAIFLTSAAGGFTRLLLEDVQVIGVGSTTASQATTTIADGAQTTEQLPRTLMTLALNQKDAERVLQAETTGALAFGLLTDASDVAVDRGTTPTDLFE